MSLVCNIIHIIMFAGHIIENTQVIIQYVYFKVDVDHMVQL